MWYEVCMTVYMGWEANQRKIPKWLPFKNYKVDSLNMNVQIRGTYVHEFTKYEVPTSNPVPGGSVHRQQCQCRMMMHGGQNRIV